MLIKDTWMHFNEYFYATLYLSDVMHLYAGCVDQNPLINLIQILIFFNSSVTCFALPCWVDLFTQPLEIYQGKSACCNSLKYNMEEDTEAELMLNMTKGRDG